MSKKKEHQTLTINKEKLQDIFDSLIANGHSEHCDIVNAMLSEMMHLRRIITYAKENLKHPDDAYEQAFNIYDKLQTEVDAWDNPILGRVKIELAE